MGIWSNCYCLAMKVIPKLTTWTHLAISCSKMAVAKKYSEVSQGMDGGNLTGAGFQTPTFSTRVFTNATHARFEIHLSIQLSELGWISIGHGSRMSNSRMMVMWPVVDNADEDGEWIISYRSTTGHLSPKSIPPKIENVIEVNQLELINSTKVAFYFTRPLFFTAIDTLDRGPGQNFVWALSSNRPSGNDSAKKIHYHDLGHGTVILDLGKPIPRDGIIRSETNSLRDLTHSYRHDGLITVHATLLSVAWIFCTPVAILSARLMRSRSTKWIKIHWVLQILTAILTLIGVICASVAVGAGSHTDSHQKKMGFMVVIAMLFQIVEGYAIHAGANKTRARRPLQNWLHMFLGAPLVLFSWLTVVFGIKEWETQGRGTPVSVSVIMGLAMGTTLFFYFLGLFRLPKCRQDFQNESFGIGPLVGVSDLKQPERPNSLS